MKIKASILTRIALLFVAALLLASAAVFSFSYRYMLKVAEEQSVEISQAATTARPPRSRQRALSCPRITM